MSKKVSQTLVFVLASGFALSSYAAVCQLTVVNALPAGYSLKDLRVSGGSCGKSACPTEVGVPGSVTFNNDGSAWDTVLTSSVYKTDPKGGNPINTGSFRVEIQNATTTCSPVKVNSDSCSTDPTVGYNPDCTYVGTQNDTTLTVGLQMK